MISQSVKYIAGYSAITFVLVAYAVQSSLARANNYLVLVYELTDGSNLAIMLNFLLWCFVSFGKLSQVIMFGPLRDIEREHIMEQLPFFVINSAVTFGSGTGDSTLLLNATLFGIITFSKVFHWILADRIDHMNSTIANVLSSGGKYNWVQVFRHYLTNIHFLWNIVFLGCDIVIAKFLVFDVFQGVNSIICLLFGFQFAMQALDVVSHFLKTCLNIYELAAYPNYEEDELEEEPVVAAAGAATEAAEAGAADGADVVEESAAEVDEAEADDDDDDAERVWENKGLYSKLVEMFVSSCKLLSYLSFIWLLATVSSIFVPFFLLQGAYATSRDIFKQFNLLKEYLESAKLLDSRLPDATREHLSDGDSSCIVCLDVMRSVEECRASNKKLSSRKRPKVLQCGHILHMGCLKDWLERSDNCPLCRRKVFGETPAAATTPVNEPPPQAAVAVPDVPAFHHPPHHLLQRFEEFEDLLRQQRDPEPVEVVDNSDPPRNAFQHIDLPSNALLPPNWTILPIDRSSESGVDYKVRLSTHTTADLRVRPRTRVGDINIIDPNFSQGSSNSNM